MALNPYALTTHDGKRVDVLTHYALLEAERRLGYPLTILQGSYNTGGVSASAGTHDGGGAVDLSAWDWERKVKVLREVGFCAWHRTALPGVWGEHIHAVLRGNARLAPVAARQVESYDRHRDGLAGDSYDPFPYHPSVTFKMPTHERIRVAFSNLNQFAAKDAAHIAFLCSKADVLLLVECIDRAGVPVPVADCLPQGWAVAHDASTSAKAGSAVAWNTAVLTANRLPSLQLLTSEVVIDGAVMVRDRYVMVQTLKTNSTGEKFRFAAAHFPPDNGPAYRAAWPQGIDRIRRLRRRPLLPPLVLGCDRNDDIHEFAEDVHMIASGRNIVGTLIPPKRIRVVSEEIDPYAKTQGWTDHLDIFTTLERK